MEAVKAFVKGYSTSKTSKRQELLSDLLNAAGNKDLPLPVVKLSTLALGNTVFIYQDRRSRLGVEKVLDKLCSLYGSPIVSALCTVLEQVCPYFVPPAGPAMSKLALTALHWSIIASKHCQDANDIIVNVQAILFSATVPHHQKQPLRAWKLARKQLFSLWQLKPHLVPEYIARLLAGEETLHSLCLLALLVEHSYKNGLLDSSQQEAVYNYYRKVVLASRTKPFQHIVASCGPLFRNITHDQFSSYLLSPSLKCLLRNPDELLEAVAHLISVLPLDCSKYAEDFVKNSIAHLSSPLPTTRNHALKLVTALAVQCTDLGPVEAVMSQLLTALKSSPNGKLTITEHRSSLLAAIETLCLSPLSLASRQQLARKTILGSSGNSIQSNSLLGYLKSEVHVGTACVGVGVLVKWCGVVGEGEAIPSPIIEHLKSVFSGKTATQLRTAYLHCIPSLCRSKDHTASLLPQFLPILESSVDKSAGKSAQAAALEEGLVAVYILLELQGVGGVSNQVWSLVSEQLLSHKLTTTITNELKLILVKVAGKVLTSDNQSLKKAQRREWVLCVLSLFLSLPWSSRKTAATSLSEIVDHNTDWSEVLVDGLENAVKRSEVNHRAVLEALQCLATPTHPRREVIALSLLLLSHHPLLVDIEPNAWICILRKLELEPHALVAELTNQILSLVLDGMATRPDQSRSALQTLLRVNEECIVEGVVGDVCRVLGAPEVVSVTTEDMEILMTPPNQLWHHQLWQELNSSLVADVSVNMRREGKLYSFEDQKWDVEMRLEMEKKKKRELLEGAGGGEKVEKNVRALMKEAKLSQKQKDNILGQLLLEESTRERLLHWDQLLAQVTSVVEEVGGVRMICHVTRLASSVLGSMRSPLTQSYCSRVWTVLAHGVIKEWTLAQRFSVTSFSILTSASTSSSHSTVLHLLSDLQHHIPPSPLHSHTLHTVTLPLLRRLLVEERVESVLESAVAVLCNAVKRYAQSVVMETEEAVPNLFHEADTLKILSSLITSEENTGRNMRIKKSCVQTFVSLLKSVPSLTPEILTLLTSDLSDPCSLLRETTLRALIELGSTPLVSHPPLEVALLVTRHDSEEVYRTLAERLWETSGYLLTEEMGPLLLQQAYTVPPSMQSATALALSLWLQTHSHKAPELMEDLLGVYEKKRIAPPPKEDKFGRTVVVEISDPWECRVGVARALEQLPSHMSPEETMTLLNFTIPGALSDPSPDVLAALMAAAKTAIGCHGADIADQLMEHCEACLKSAGDTRESDIIRHSIVVLMGTLAKHLDKGNPKVKAVVNLLLSNLDTPSQTVQEAIAGCLPPLASVVKPEAEAILTKLLEKLLESTSYSQRRGAAYGLAGLVKGLGIPSLKQHRIMPALQEAIKNKKNYRHREGALFAFECLCNILGRLFEPYVVHLLPDLLLCFGDGNQYVREATDHTARTIMGNLSSHGVKLILPSLLTALEEDSWRTKAGSAELLGAMAFCAPKQLSSCLPSIVPRLMEVLADSHSKVQNSGNTALKQIGSVIKNPEIQVLVPILLDALTDPSSNKAHVCLQSLLDTEFVHVIDPPSLALIMPTLKRTLELRSTESKKMAAQIIGNMYSLTDKKDLAPYLAEVLPGLKSSLVDPVPEVRNVCAKALGAMVRGMGDDTLGELLPWLLETLQSESSAVDRSGAAQGLSEVLLAQGYDRLAQLMPRFLESSQDLSNPTHIRDGYLMLFIYLPIAFGNEFTPFLAELLPCILKGLADESEYIRDTSLQAGQTVVNRYGDTAVELFLPELERGLFDGKWRIRCSSIQLLGDLLYKVSGLSGKMSTESEEDDNFGTEVARTAIIRALGEERRNRVLAGLYMGRSDVALMVRQAALHVWKVVVTHTVRTLREILPTLISLLLSFLGSDIPDKSKVAARTLGDLVRKLGERVLPDVIPMLERGLNSSDTKERQGVCIGLSEIIQQTSREHILLYMDSLLPTVRSSLCDSQEEVRAAAAQTFNSLHNTIGPRILDEVLAPLLKDLSSSSQRSEVALDGLKQVMAVKSRVVLPHIIPQLVKPPVNARALALLSSVAGEALHSHLHRIIPALISSLVGEVDQDTWDAAEGVVLSVQGEPGLATLIEELVKAAKKETPQARAAAMGLLLAMCSGSSVDLTEHVPHLIIFVTEAFNDPSESVCERAWLSLEALVKRVHQKELPHYIGYLRKALKTVANMLIGEELRGFSLKGITPCLTMLKEGLISGSPDEKEEAARVLIEVIHLSSSKTLSTGKVVMLIAGPLIRVLGDRYGWSVKVATLEALVELIRKVGTAAKSFLPQLQTSYLKALGDVNRPVRVQAVTGLTELLPLSIRVDPVFNELHNGVKKNEDPALRLSILQALHGAIRVAGARMSEKHKTEILATLLTLYSTAQEGNRLQAAQCTGVLCSYLSEDQLTSLLRDTLLQTDGESDWSLLQARAVAMSAVVEAAASQIEVVGMEGEVVKAAVKFASSDRIPVCVSGLQALCSCINHLNSEPTTVLPALIQDLNHSSTDVRIAACDACSHITQATDPLLTTILPLLLSNTQEKNTAVRASAESSIMEIISDDTRLNHCMSLLEVSANARKLENIFNKLKAKMAKEN